MCEHSLLSPPDNRGKNHPPESLLEAVRRAAGKIRTLETFKLITEAVDSGAGIELKLLVCPNDDGTASVSLRVREISVTKKLWSHHSVPGLTADLLEELDEALHAQRKGGQP